MSEITISRVNVDDKTEIVTARANGYRCPQCNRRFTSGERISGHFIPGTIISCELGSQGVKPLVNEEITFIKLHS